MKFTISLLVFSLFLVLALAESPFEQIRLIEEHAFRNYLLRNHELNSEDLPDRIVGGDIATENVAPFLGQLYGAPDYLGVRYSFMCGGSLISSRTFLSAGHCVNKRIPYRIRYGSNFRSKSTLPDIKVKEVKLHPGFNMYTIQNDIALFILSEPITPGSNVRTIGIQTEPISQTNNTVTLFGFGLTQGANKKPAERLRSTELKVIDEGRCKTYVESLGVPMHPGMICTHAPNRSACNGDSGGPLVLNASGNVTGIVSFGTRHCPPGSINVFTEVSHYQEWITTNMVQ